MKKLIIFDLDGTLLNTLADLTTAVNYAMQQCGYPTHSIEEIRSFVGNGIGKLLERSLPACELNPTNLSSVRELFLAYYGEHSADLSAPYPGIISLLATLQERGLQLAVASNKYQVATQALVARFFPAIHFVKVSGQCDGVPTKPHPQIVYTIMQEANVASSDILYVGDSDVDMQTALNAGVQAVGVSWGFRPAESLLAYHPLAVIDQPDALLALLDQE